MAERSGQLLVELVPSIKKTADLVQEVAATSQEQSSGVSQINKAMSQVEQITQRNASAAEELASTAEEMSSNADALLQLVAFFRVRDAGEPSRLRLVAQAAPALEAHAPAVHHALALPTAVPATAIAKPNGRRTGSDRGFERF